jgi:hypothetical protein
LYEFAVARGLADPAVDDGGGGNDESEPANAG